MGTGMWILCGVLTLLLLFLLSHINIWIDYGEIIQVKIQYLFFTKQILPEQDAPIQTEQLTVNEPPSGTKKKSKPSLLKKSSQIFSSQSVGQSGSSKAATAKKEKTHEEKKAAKTLDVMVDELIEKTNHVLLILRSSLYGLNRLLRRIRLDHIEVEIILGEEDAAQTGIQYGRTCAYVYGGVAALQNYLKLKIKKLQISADWTQEILKVTAKLRIHIPIYVIFWAVGSALCKLIIGLVQRKMAAQQAAK